MGSSSRFGRLVGPSPRTFPVAGPCLVVAGPEDYRFPVRCFPLAARSSVSSSAGCVVRSATRTRGSGVRFRKRNPELHRVGIGFRVVLPNPNGDWVPRAVASPHAFSFAFGGGRPDGCVRTSRFARFCAGFGGRAARRRHASGEGGGGADPTSDPVSKTGRAGSPRGRPGSPGRAPSLERRPMAGWPVSRKLSERRPARSSLRNRLRRWRCVRSRIPADVRRSPRPIRLDGRSALRVVSGARSGAS